MKPYYEAAGIALYLGDCREVLPALNVTADCVVTDPPYGETSSRWDRWPPGWLADAAQVSRSMWAFGSLRMYLKHGSEWSAAGWKFSHDVIWKKHNASGPDADRFRRIHEQPTFWYQGKWKDIYKDPQKVPAPVHRAAVPAGRPKDIGHRGEYAQRGWADDGTRLLTSVLSVRSMHRKGAIHRAQKPPGILTPLIRYACPAGGLIVDPFAGSASILETAALLGCRAIGIELHEPNAEAAARHLQGLLFLGGAA